MVLALVGGGYKTAPVITADTSPSEAKKGRLRSVLDAKEYGAPATAGALKYHTRRTFNPSPLRFESMRNREAMYPITAPSPPPSHLWISVRYKSPPFLITTRPEYSPYPQGEQDRPQMRKADTMGARASSPMMKVYVRGDRGKRQTVCDRLSTRRTTDTALRTKYVKEVKEMIGETVDYPLLMDIDTPPQQHLHLNV